MLHIFCAIAAATTMWGGSPEPPHMNIKTMQHWAIRRLRGQAELLTGMDSPLAKSL
jgi:hypothetical protein